MPIASGAAIPHDLWPAGTLSQASLAEQLTLLLVGFDQQWTARPEDGAVVIAPVERPVQVTAWHKPPRGSHAKRSEFLRLAPEAKTQAQDGRWTLTGMVEEHILLDGFLRGEADSSRRIQKPAVKPQPAFAAKRISLKLREQPLGAILDRLAKSLDLEFDVNKAPPQAMQQRISLSVKEVTLSALLQEMGEKAGCELHLQDRQIVVEQP